MARAFVAIGSNINAAENVRAAIAALAMRLPLSGISTVYCTEPLERSEQPAFYNCVVEVDAAISPRDLKFRVLRPIEEALGRRRSSDKHAPRTIDLDLILYDDLILNDKDLIVPDPEIAGRFFLAVPLAELDPDLVIPGTGVRISAIAAGFSREKACSLIEYSAALKRDLMDS